MSLQEGGMYLSMLPTEALQLSVIKDLLLELGESRFACISTPDSKDNPLLIYLSQYVDPDREQALAVTCSHIDFTRELLKELNVALTAIRASGVRIILVHSNNLDSVKIIQEARKLSMRKLGDDFVWIFTDKAIGPEGKVFPKGSYGVQTTHETGHYKRQTQRKQLLNDSMMLFARGLKRTLDDTSLISEVNYREVEQFSSLKKKLYRYNVLSD